MDSIPNKNTCAKVGGVSSLEKMCFDLIVQKFQRFYFAFTISTNLKHQRSCEFLQRRFSFQLLTALYENKSLKEEYFKVLINGHLHFLEGKWLKNSLYSTSKKDIFRRLPNLTNFSFRDSCCNDGILKNIAKFCPNIVEIDIRFSKITDVGVVYLCEKNGMVPCPKLKILLIKYSGVTDIGAEYLIRKLPLLEKIDYCNVHLLLHSIHQESLAKHQKVHYYNLVEINFKEDTRMYESMDENKHEYFSFYSEVLKTCLTICPKLESIACFITDKEQLNFFNNSHLKKLDLCMWNTNSKLNVDEFLKINGRNLTSLRIKGCTLSVSLLAESCQVLEEFRGRDVNFRINDDGVQLNFPCLIECTISDIRPLDTKAFCSLLSYSPKLESVIFSCCVLSLEMKNQIETWCINSSAKKINFCYLFLEKIFVRDILLSCRSLATMCFENCAFDTYGVEHFFKTLAKRLPNKPRIYFQTHCSIGMQTFPVNDGQYYLRMHPDEKYKSSSTYGCLLHEMDLVSNACD